MGKYQWVDEVFSSEMIADRKRIVERLKARSDEMQAVYEEIEGKVPRDFSRRELLRAIIYDAFIYDEKTKLKIDSGRPKKKRKMGPTLEELQAALSETANKMIELLDSCSTVTAEGIFYSEACTDPLYLLKEAGKATGPYERKALFNKYVFSALKELSVYNGRYMPSLQDVLKMLVYEIDSNPVIGQNPDIDAIMTAREISPRAFLYGYWNSIKELQDGGTLNTSFKLTNRALSIIVKSALDMQITTGSIKEAWVFIRKSKPKR